MLYITSKRVVFTGGSKNITYPINKIVNLVRYSDGIQFQKENESGIKIFLFDNEYAIDEIGALIFKLN